MRQIDKIIFFCEAHGSITQRQALALGIYRLASRINDMRRMGFIIDTELITVTNRDGSKSRVAKYTILLNPFKEDTKNEKAV